jgi:hypothetical protein
MPTKYVDDLAEAVSQLIPVYGEHITKSLLDNLTDDLDLAETEFDDYSLLGFAEYLTNVKDTEKVTISQYFNRE